MPDIGFFELLLIGAAAFLILGPERTPEFFAQIGRFMRQGREWIANVKQQIDDETKVLKDPIKAARDALDEGISSVSDPLDKHDTDRK
ncbi:MAG: hypothetical protein R8K49_09580 [Mariprofundaceae bacterium]